MSYTPFPTILYPGAVAAWCEAEEKARKQAEKDAAKAAREAEKRRLVAVRIAQAEEDKAFALNQLKRLYKTAEAARNDIAAWQSTVAQDEQLNRYGAIVPEKTVEAHRKARDKALSKAISTETAIHQMERKLRKAEYIITEGRFYNAEHC